MTLKTARQVITGRIGGKSFKIEDEVLKIELHLAMCRVAYSVEPESHVSSSVPKDGYLRAKNDIYILEPKFPNDMDEELDLPSTLQHAAIFIVCGTLVTEGKNWWMSQADDLLDSYRSASDKTLAATPEKLAAAKAALRVGN